MTGAREKAPPPEGDGAYRAAVQAILADLYDAGADGGSAQARRTALHHAYTQIAAALPKQAGL